MMEDQAIEQRLQNINDQPQNPDEDQLEIEINLTFWNQGFKNFEEVVVPENSAGNPEVELDQAVKATVSPEEEEEPAKMATASADGDDDDDIEINVEDLDDSSNEEPLLSQQHIPSTSECSGKQEMSSISKEESPAAQDAEASKHVAKESVSRGYKCIDTLLDTLTCTCGKKYPKIKSLSAHIIHFNKERNYQCDYCESHFSNLIGFVNHLKDSHEHEVEPQAPIIDERQRRSRSVRKEPERYGTNLDN